MVKIQDSSRFGVMILAAGLGKRMRSEFPKVLHELSGKPLLFHVLKQVGEVFSGASIAIVVGYGREAVEAYVRQEPLLKNLNITFILQAEQRGTGHAARCAIDSPWGLACVQQKLPILVLPGDLPLISAELIAQMIVPLKKGEALRLLTCRLANPTGYGRLVRKGKSGPALRIVEEKDASHREKEIQEVAVSIYFFDAVCLKSYLQRLSNQNAQNEYYLTDVIGLAQKAKKGIGLLTWKCEDDLKGVNDLWDLAQAAQLMNQRVLRKWALLGVKFLAPLTVRVDVTVELSEGVEVDAGVVLLGKTRINRNTVVGPQVFLKDSEVGENVRLKVGSVVENSQIGAGSHVGPYAHLRPSSQVGSNVKIGNFVELKKSKIGDHTSIAHLSYLGDAEVGSRVNIGCGFVTCNFDGKRKNVTVIEDDVFLGSDCQTVAPVKVGKGSYVASGSTLTEDVPPHALAIARSRQVNKIGYAPKLALREPCPTMAPGGSEKKER